MKIGIISAMDQELLPIRRIIHNLEKIEKSTRTFWEGEIYGQRFS
jgi:nucleoside phosphorylase